MPDPASIRETSIERIGEHALLARLGERAGAVRSRLRDEGRHAWDLLCVVDDDHVLQGTLTAQQLAALHDDAPIDRTIRRDGPVVAPDLDQERMATHAIEHGVSAMPVVDARGRLLGVVGPLALMDVLRREHVEDLHRLAGMTRETQQAQQAIEAPPLRRARHRLPWLLVGLAGSALATLVVARFEQALAARPALAFFVPGLVYLADAIGTQSEAVAVRGLSLSRAGLAHLAGGELRTGMLIGLVLALAALPLVWLAFGDLHLALAVALALGLSSVIASVLGVMLPWALGRLKLDPAYGAGPLATIVQDVLSLLIYFVCVSFIVL
jgi:magnesium transporter